MAATQYVDVREWRHKNAKLWIWIIWMAAMIVSALYCVVAIFSFENIVTVYNAGNQDNVEDHQLWAFLVATILPPAMTIGFFVFGTVILLCSTVSESGLTYSFGCLHMSCLWLATLVLHSAVSIHAYRRSMQEWERQGENDGDNVVDWDGGKTTLAQVAYIMGYFLTAVYLIMWVLIFWFRGAVQTFIVDPKIAAARKKEEEKAEAENAAVSPPEPAKTEPIKKDDKPAEEKVNMETGKSPDVAETSDVKMETKEGESGKSSTSFSWWSRKKNDSDSKV